MSPGVRDSSGGKIVFTSPVGFVSEVPSLKIENGDMLSRHQKCVSG